MEMAKDSGLQFVCTYESLVSLLPEAISNQATLTELFESLNWLLTRPKNLRRHQSG